MQKAVRILVCGLWLACPLMVHADGGGSNGGSKQSETSSNPQKVQADYEAGYRLVKAEQYKDAIKAFKKVLKEDPTHAMAYTNMAYSYRKLGQYKEAVALYEKALALEPNLAEAHEYIGEAFVALGQLEDAKRHLAILEKLDPKMAEDLRAEIDRHKRS